jgi:hypothetical protein
MGNDVSFDKVIEKVEDGLEATAACIWDTISAKSKPALSAIS